MSRLYHEDILPDENQPFKHCKLNRKKVADSFTELLESIVPDGVIALNNEWGTGKTTFVRMWCQHLLNYDEKYHPIYFNVWEYEFYDRVFISLLSELSEVFGKDSKKAEILKNLKKSAPYISDAILGNNRVSSLVKAFNSCGRGNALFDDYKEQKRVLKDFKEKLTQYIAGNRKVVFLIDELDRCKPDYAVRFLEIIKHLFSIKGLFFVLVIDKKQLEGTVNKLYGDKFDSKEYLRRFFHLELTLPEPNTSQAVDYFSEYFGVGTERDENGRNPVNIFIKSWFTINTTSLRTIEKSISKLSYFIKYLFKNPENQVIKLIPLTFLLIDIDYRFPQIYSRIKEFMTSPEELLELIVEAYDLSNPDINLEEIKPFNVEDCKDSIAEVHGRLIYHYMKCLTKEQQHKFLVEHYDKYSKICTLEFPFNKDRFGHAFGFAKNGYNFSIENLSLKMIIDKINFINR